MSPQKVRLLYADEYDELDDYEELDEYNEEADPEELELEYDEEEDY